jgi:hypothetical protein
VSPFHDKLPKAQILRHLPSHGSVPANPLVRASADQDVLAVGNRVASIVSFKRPIHSSVPKAQQGEDLWLDEPLSEAAELLMADQRESGGRVLHQGEYSGLEQGRSVDGIGIRKEDKALFHIGGALAARPRLSKPSRWKGSAREDPDLVRASGGN